jgi:acyl-CoA synthetase (AMP-forming)/AMP-acid ligase II
LYALQSPSGVSTSGRCREPGLGSSRLEQFDRVVGRVLEHDLLAADSGETLGRGESGEFQTRGYSVMLGYWEDPDRTAEAIDADGWMHTGDLAVMDDEGYVKIGRIKDMIIRGGENVYPREVEEFLYTHSATSSLWDLPPYIAERRPCLSGRTTRQQRHLGATLEPSWGAPASPHRQPRFLGEHITPRRARQRTRPGPLHAFN